MRNSEKQNIYPRLIVFENTGSATAFEVEVEVRKYYDVILPPTYDMERQKLTATLKQGETFQVVLLKGSDEPAVPGSRGIFVADFFDFEVFVRYSNQAKQGQ